MSAVSSDLLWALTKKNNAYLVKRRESGGVEWSRDPLNASGKNQYSHSGLVNDKAVGVVKCQKTGKITLVTKSAKHSNKPAKQISATSFKLHTPGRKVAHAVSKAAHGYRQDVAQDAIVKASALARADNKPAKEVKVTSRRA